MKTEGWIVFYGVIIEWMGYLESFSIESHLGYLTPFIYLQAVAMKLNWKLCKMIICKLWLSVILLSGLIKAKESASKEKTVSASTSEAIDPVTEERLKERWTAFVAEVNKELDFDTNASSQG